MKRNSGHIQQPTFSNESAGFEAVQNTRAQATSLFWQAFYGEKWHRFWSRLRSNENQLQSLAQESEQAPVTARHYSGIKSVPLDQINCSEGRSKDFDAQFRPASSHNKDRWVGVAAAWQTGKTLPPIDLVRVGDSYCVRDGHHRLSVAREFGQLEIDAQVTVWELS